YVDSELVKVFHAKRSTGTQFLIEPAAGVIEVRGRDGDEEITLAALLVCCDEIPVEGVFRDSIAHQDDQRIEIQLEPIRDANGDIKVAQVAVFYTAPRALSSLPRLAGLLRTRTQQLIDHIAQHTQPEYGWLVAVGILVI